MRKIRMFIVSAIACCALVMALYGPALVAWAVGPDADKIVIVGGYQGATISINKMVQGLELDTTAVQVADTTPTAGSTVVKTLPDAGGAIGVVCGGTIHTDTNGTRTLTLLGGSTVVASVVSEATDVGDYHATFMVTALSGTTVKASGTVAIDNAAAVDADYATTALDISAVTTWTVRMTLAHADDEMSLQYCTWTYYPDPSL